MARLKIFYQNEVIQEIDLSLKLHWLFGRDPACDVVLDKDPAISRRHFEITALQDGRYKVTRVTINPLLFYENQPVEGIFLDQALTFEIPSYRFEFIPGENQPESEFPAEKTVLGVIPYLAYLVRLDSKGAVTQRYSLIGNQTVVGRDAQCDIAIDEPHLSRQHFAIIRRPEGFFLKDLNSSNGTLLNDTVLEPNQEYPLKAEDEIRAVELRFRFELVDASFQEKANALAPMEEGSYPESPVSEPDSSVEEPFEEKSPRDRIRAFLLSRRVWVIRLALAILALASVGWFLWLSQNSKTGDDSPKPTDVANPFDRLSPDQKLLVEQLYKNAQNYMQMGKYELAKQELTKLHDIIPFYQDSRQLEEACNQAIELLREKEKLEAEAREQERIQKLIEEKIQECQALLTPDTTKAQMEACLSEALSYDPSNPAIVQLIQQAERFEQEKKFQEEQRRLQEAQSQQLWETYEKAKNFEQSGSLLEALQTYKEVEESDLFDGKGVKSKARARRQALEAQIRERQRLIQEKAFEKYRRKQLKEAIELIREALVINPKNQVLLGLHEEWMDDLRKSLMPIYQEAAFEESIGEIESAIQKWKYIQRNSLPGEDYYEKSRVKLKRYGAL